MYKEMVNFILLRLGNYSYGTFSTLEPVSEYIASAIGYTLNINICNSFIEEIDVFHKKSFG